MFKAISFVGLCSVILVGCASFKPGDQATEAELKNFSPVVGKTSLYVCREDSFQGGGVSTTVLVDNENIGTTRRNTFVHTVIEAGKHNVQTKNDGIAGMSNSAISIETKPDEVAFLWIGVTGHGWGSYTIDYFDNTQQAKDCVVGAKYAVKAE